MLLSKPWVWPSSFGIQMFKSYLSWFIQVFFLFFNNDEDTIFGLQSECRESELTPKLLSTPTFFFLNPVILSEQ